MKIAFDTEVLLAFYLGEKGGLRVRAYLERIQRGEAEGIVNVINLAELFYVLYRKEPKIAAEKEANLRAYGVRIVEVPYDQLWREAAKIKAVQSVALADAFAAATAKLENAALLTGRDAEFEGLGLELIRLR